MNPADPARIDLANLILELRLEARSTIAKVEIFQVINVLAFTSADRIEIVFHLRRELIVDQCRKVFLQ